MDPLNLNCYALSVPVAVFLLPLALTSTISVFNSSCDFQQYHHHLFVYLCPTHLIVIFLMMVIPHVLCANVEFLREAWVSWSTDNRTHSTTCWWFPQIQFGKTGWCLPWPSPLLGQPSPLPPQHKMWYASPVGQDLVLWFLPYCSPNFFLASIYCSYLFHQ
jgi:hypothetical protein